MSVQREDLEAKLREIQEALDETKGNVATVGIGIVAIVVVVVLAAFLFGRRKGGKGKSRIEVYEVRG